MISFILPAPVWQLGTTLNVLAVKSCAETSLHAGQVLNTSCVFEPFHWIQHLSPVWET